jgi:hypothetical protein
LIRSTTGLVASMTEHQCSLSIASEIKNRYGFHVHSLFP